MRRAFTLIELLVVVGIIALLLAISVPAMRYAREQGRETVCRSNLRQLAIILKTYTSEHNDLFPDARFIYHSAESFDPIRWAAYYICCRWHDERMGYDSILLRDNPELRGSLGPYLGGREILLCPVGRRANDLRGCWNTCRTCRHDGTIPVACQYTYAMNTYLGSTVQTGRASTATSGLDLDERTLRKTPVKRTSQVTRNPAEVFTFAETNSWAVNIKGIQPIAIPPRWPADYNLSGGCGTWPIRLGNLEVLPTHAIRATDLLQDGESWGGAFATYHRPRGDDLNTGYSFAAMLDGHVRKITVADQLRQSRRVQGLDESRLGPGGHLALAWPIDIPPPGGWENQ